jgi:dTDP-6-deoxy-L-talose 4-dehydrogenase (NAD+)
MSNTKTVLITGAGGYIGRYVVKAILDKGVNVCAVDINTEQIDSRANKMCFDIFTGSENIYEELGRPDVCLHMAWKDGFVHNADSHIQNLFHHYNFIRNMINGGLKHIAVMGSMHEIGFWVGEVDENTPTNPRSLYGITKNSLRQMTGLLVNASDVTFQWLRAYYILGDDLKNKSIFSKITSMELEGQAIFPFNSGKNKYDFITVQELGEQIASAVMQNEINGIINCCTGKPVALRDKVDEFLSKNGFKIKPQYGAFPERAYDSPAIWGNADKIKKIMLNNNERQ